MKKMSLPPSIMILGEIEELPYQFKQIEWRINNFFSANRNDITQVSPAFSFPDDTLWHLNLFKKGSPECVNLYLERNVKREYTVEYYIGLKKKDGKVEILASGILLNTIDTVSFIKISELVERKSEFLPKNNLSIICIMKLLTERIHSTQQTLEKKTPTKLIKLEKLSKNFKDLFNDKETCDVTINVQDKEYKAHKTVLIARSSVFAATFRHDTLEKQTGIITITDCDPDTFQEFLHYLYCGILEEFTLRSALNLYYTSDKYDIEELKAFCVDYLMQCLTIETIIEIAVFADKYDISSLSNAVQDFFNENSLKILLTSEWACLMGRNHRLANKLLTEMAKMKLKE